MPLKFKITRSNNLQKKLDLALNILNYQLPTPEILI